MKNPIINVYRFVATVTLLSFLSGGLCAEDNSDAKTTNSKKRQKTRLVGNWKATAGLPNGESRDLTLSIKNNKGKLTVISKGETRESTFDRVTLDGNKVRFERDYERDGNTGTIRVDAVYKQRKLKGTWSLLDSTGTEISAGDYSAEKQKPPYPPILIGNWNMVVDFQGQEIDYTLRISKSKQGLAGKIISPRSGERDLKSVEFKDGKLTMKETREYEGAEVSSIFTAALKQRKLSGSASLNSSQGTIESSWSAEKAAKKTN
ncbi:MAG TPA: hypothetical protein EYQ50_22275 [Verrucomicrobiales bacterium]|nr:hypothetical protein [Verrucomicrobiales bacterium]HIL70686.1 hypothetical protein [Verrucomicrobiota bacterium]